MFRGNLSKIKFRLEAGMNIIISGAVSVYTPRGDYQINCFNLEPSGEGALNKAYEQLKSKLEKKAFLIKFIKNLYQSFQKILQLSPQLLELL